MSQNNPNFRLLESSDFALVPWLAVLATLSDLSRLDWLAFRSHISKTEVVSRAIDNYNPTD